MRPDGAAGAIDGGYLNRLGGHQPCRRRRRADGSRKAYFVRLRTLHAGADPRSIRHVILVGKPLIAALDALMPESAESRR